MRGKESRKVINLLARVLYEVLSKSVSIDVAFKHACGGVCAKDLDERERLYELTRNFISDYVKVLCAIGSRGRSKVSRKEIARLWLSGSGLNALEEPWCRLSYSKWFYEKIVSLLGKEEGEELLAAMNRRYWWLRVNTLLAPTERVIRELEREGVELEVDKHYYYMIKVIKSPKPIRLLKPVKNFTAIPHDKASAAVVEALEPEADDVIVDLAAAPGIKTSLIMMLTENKARVIAIDISLKRIKSMIHLLKNYGVDLSRVNVVLGDSIHINLSREVGKALLDAPCSNSGAVSKDPALKFLVNEERVLRYSQLQRRLIENAVKISRTIVYSTCSLMPEEGEQVIEYITKRVPDIKLVKPVPWSSNGYSAFKDISTKVSRLFPHKHETEGFFISKIISN